MLEGIKFRVKNVCVMMVKTRTMAGKGTGNGKKIFQVFVISHYGIKSW